MNTKYKFVLKKLKMHEINKQNCAYNIFFNSYNNSNFSPSSISPSKTSSRIESTEYKTLPDTISSAFNTQIVWF